MSVGSGYENCFGPEAMKGVGLLVETSLDLVIFHSLFLLATEVDQKPP